MSEIIRVKILEDGISCREVNPYSEILNREDYIDEEVYKQNCMVWNNYRRKDESKLRTFKIDFSHLNQLFQLVEEKAGAKIVHTNVGHEAGSIHQAEVIDKETVRII